ncbi:MAG TPA: ABC transporter permease subunit, partial [Alphaproteobacteria bacterium]|nr:ABC transporter permease subunit [Alphaproteobacteria bacterium]
MRRRLAIWFYRLLLVALGVGVWQIGVDRGFISHFFFGSPVVIASRLYDWFASGEIYRHLLITLEETVLAFLIGTGLGLAIGLALALNATASAVLDPFIKAANSMPRLILAPIFAVWFGLGIWSKVALGVTIVFFIVFFNVYQGVK